MLTKKKLMEFKKRISDHFYNEAQIMCDLLETNELTQKEFKELNVFMRRHPVAEAVNFIKKKRDELRAQKK